MEGWEVVWYKHAGPVRVLLSVFSKMQRNKSSLVILIWKPRLIAATIWWVLAAWRAGGAVFPVFCYLDWLHPWGLLLLSHLNVSSDPADKPTLKWVYISGGPKLENCPTDMKPALKLPALQLTEQTGKGQSAGQSNRCLLHHSDLRVIDFFSLWREGVDGLKVLPKGVEKKGRKGERKKGKREGAKECERWRGKQKVVVEVGTCLPSWLCPKLQGGGDLQLDSNRTSTHVLRCLGSAPNLLLLRQKWSWTEKASGLGGSDASGPFFCRKRLDQQDVTCFSVLTDGTFAVSTAPHKSAQGKSIVRHFGE